jgi:hypothetical protein
MRRDRVEQCQARFPSKVMSRCLVGDRLLGGWARDIIDRYRTFARRCVDRPPAANGFILPWPLDCFGGASSTKREGEPHHSMTALRICMLSPTSAIVARPSSPPQSSLLGPNRAPTPLLSIELDNAAVFMELARLLARSRLP